MVVPAHYFFPLIIFKFYFNAWPHLSCTCNFTQQHYTNF